MVHKTLCLLLLLPFLAVTINAREVSPIERARSAFDELKSAVAKLPAGDGVTYGLLRDAQVERRMLIKRATEEAYRLHDMMPACESIFEDLLVELLQAKRFTWLEVPGPETSVRRKIVRDYRKCRARIDGLLQDMQSWLQTQKAKKARPGRRSFECGFRRETHGLALRDGEVCLGASLLVLSSFRRATFKPEIARPEDRALRSMLRFVGDGGSVTIPGFPSLYEESKAEAELFFDECERINERANAALNGFLGLRYIFGDHRLVARYKGWDDSEHNQSLYETILQSLKDDQPLVLGFVCEIKIKDPLRKAAAKMMGARDVDRASIARHAVVVHALEEFGDEVRMSIWDPNSCVIDGYAPEFRYHRGQGVFYFVTDPWPRRFTDLSMKSTEVFAAKVFLPQGRFWKDRPRGEWFRGYGFRQDEGEEGPLHDGLELR